MPLSKHETQFFKYVYYFIYKQAVELLIRGSFSYLNENSPTWLLNIEKARKMIFLNIKSKGRFCILI